MATSTGILVAGLQRRDESAQRRFWEQRWAGVYAICARILGGGADATELATDVLTDFLFEHVHRLSNPRAARSYLRLMAVRRSLRRRERRRELVGKDADRLPTPMRVDAEEAAALSSLQPRLDACLGQLTDKAQQMLRLRYAQELTNTRIGQLLGCSKQYVGRLVTRSLELLRECLERGARRPGHAGRQDERGGGR